MDTSVNRPGEKVKEEHVDSEPFAVPKLELGEAAARVEVNAGVKIDVRRTNF